MVILPPNHVINVLDGCFDLGGKEGNAELASRSNGNRKRFRLLLKKAFAEPGRSEPGRDLEFVQRCADVSCLRKKASLEEKVTIRSKWQDWYHPYLLSRAEVTPHVILSLSSLEHKQAPACDVFGTIKLRALMLHGDAIIKQMRSQDIRL